MSSHKLSRFVRYNQHKFFNRQSVHENLHKLLPNIVLLSAVRNLMYLPDKIDEISSVKHDWAEKIIKDGVKNIRNSDCFGLTREELMDRTQRELELISRVPKSSKIVEIRYARAQPFVDVWARKKW